MANKRLIQGAGAVAWGAFFSVAPVAEALYFGAILWIPVLIWRECVRARNHGFWPGFLVRMTLITSIVAIALLLPAKQADSIRVGPLSRTEVSLSERSELMSRRAEFPVERGTSVIRLPSLQPSFREVVSAVERDTGLRGRVAYCGTGANLWSGGFPMYVVFEDQPPSP